MGGYVCKRKKGNKTRAYLVRKVFESSKFSLQNGSMCAHLVDHFILQQRTIQITIILRNLKAKDI
jgi:hypothetical protein